jgi:hypothetical protein
MCASQARMGDQCGQIVLERAHVAPSTIMQSSDDKVVVTHHAFLILCDNHEWLGQVIYIVVHDIAIQQHNLGLVKAASNLYSSNSSLRHNDSSR